MTHSMMEYWIDRGWATWLKEEQFPTIEIHSMNDPIVVRQRPDLPKLPVKDNNLRKKDIDSPKEIV